MDGKKRTETVALYALIAVGATAAGALNGLLGTGGGIILTFLFAYTGALTGIPPADRFAASMATVLPISLISLTTYSSEYLRDPSVIVSLAVPSALGGIAGAYLSQRVKPALLNRLFACIVIYAGIKMVL